MNIRKYLEVAFLCLVFGLFLFVGVGHLWDFKIAHEFPTGLLASDAFQHQVRVESIKQMGNYRYEADYISAGFDDAVGFYAPLLYHVSIILSSVTGLETYDTIYLLVFLYLALGALVIYFIVRKLNAHAALLGMPLVFLLYSAAQGSGPGPYATITWGSWGALTGHFFLICFFWYVMRRDLKQSWVLLALFMSALAFAHQSELIFAALFMVGYFVSSFLRKRVSLQDLREYGQAFLVFLIVSLHFLIIFAFTWFKWQGTDFKIESVTNTEPTLYLANFGILAALVVVGAMVTALSSTTRHRGMACFAFMFLLGLGNYFGISRHAWRTRALWPLYLAPFLGVGLYFVLKRVIKRWKFSYSLGLGTVLVLMTSGILSVGFLPAAASFTSPGIMDKAHWDAFLFLREHVQEEQTVLYTYGDMYSQNALLRNGFSPPYLFRFRPYVDLLQNRTVKRYIPTNLLGDRHGVFYAYRKGLLDFGYHAKELGDAYFSHDRDLCGFDFIMFDKVSRQPAFAQYNLLIANLLANNSFIAPVFDNSMVVILQNTQLGEGCIADETRF